MELSPGSRVGPYEVTALLGVGGMGEVYRATDSRLGREVAIKVLPSSLAGDLARLARFDREARVLAALNHPHIATVYGLEDAEGTKAIVMELVDGQTLADRIAMGPMPVDEALAVAQQIAGALEAAHEHGIVHRDLKPANIALRSDGTVKVLDFGLARTPDPQMPQHGHVDDSPTVTIPTDAGMILGTACYMAPEQARGRPVDRRADIWAFGCVVAELVTGRRVFQGEDVSETLALVLKGQPDLSRVPTSCLALVEKCLAKDPRARLRDIGDWQLLLTPPEAPRPITSRWLLGAAGAAVAASLALAAAGWLRPSGLPAPSSLVRFDVPIPGGDGSQTMFALSPDGRYLAIAAQENGQFHLRVRPLDALDARLIEGTEGARYPFWKPDGREIGFVTDVQLKTVSLTGGAPSVVSRVEPPVLGADWSPEGVIVLSQGRELYTLAERGGRPQLLYSDPGIPYNPAFLPDGRRFLYQENGVRVGSLDGSPPVAIAPGDMAVYADGYLLTTRAGRLLAQRFDLDRLALAGNAVPITTERIVAASIRPAFAAAGRVVAFLAEGQEQLVWKDRDGTAAETVGTSSLWRNFRLSPEQDRIAFDLRTEDGLDVGVFDIARGTTERLTTQGASFVPVFSPHGVELAFTSSRSGRFNPYVTSARDRERQVTDIGATGGYPLDWSPDGRHLLWWADEDLWIVPVDGTPAHTYAKTAFEERDAAYAPSGDWIAYTSNETGQYEVYVGPFPEDGRPRVPVSGRGGSGPAWRADGRELFYVAGDGCLTAVPVTFDGNRVKLGRDACLFPATVGLFHRTYEVSLDGQRILVSQQAANSVATITMLLDWRRLLEP